MTEMEPVQTSSIATYPLSSSTSRKALTVFAHLLSSCAGPHGKNHIVRNACGGHLTITSTCSRLLSAISVSRSELKLVVSAINGHLQQCGDGGLFMAHVCLQLTKSVLDMDLRHSVVSSTFLSFVSIIMDYIKSDSCICRVKTDFSNVKLLLAYVRSILNSKSLLNIQPEILNNLSLTVLNAFVKAIPSVPMQRYSCGVFVLGQEQKLIMDSKCVDGILLEFPEFPTYGDHIELTERIKSKTCNFNQPESFVKVALITCSMSGDMEDVVTATVEGTEQQFKDLEERVLEKTLSFCNKLERENVALVLCQRVIHPSVKVFLRSKGIIFVDRLGSQPIAFIRDLTGCNPITSILQDMERRDDYLGRLTSVTPNIENNKSYISLKNCNTSVITLVVCSELEERLSELKHCVCTCLKGLESLAKEPWLLMGGGCWQMHCSNILKDKVLSTIEEISRKLSISEASLRQLLTVFRSCLHQWCLHLKHNLEHLSFDTSSMHCWRVSKHIPLSISEEKMKSCCCGFKTMSMDKLDDLDIVLTQDDTSLSKEGTDVSCSNVKEVDEWDNLVLDNLTASLEALHKGVLTTGLLLSVGQFICDRN